MIFSKKLIKFKTLRPLSLAICLLLTFQFSSGQEKYQYKITLKEDLSDQSSRVVLDAKKDKMGYFWMMTYSGLYRYNGKSLETLEDISDVQSFNYQVNNFEEFYKINNNLLFFAEKSVRKDLKFLNLRDYSIVEIPVDNFLNKDELPITTIKSHKGYLFLISKDSENFSLYKFRNLNEGFEKMYEFEFPSDLDIAGLNFSIYNENIWTFHPSDGIRLFNSQDSHYSKLIVKSNEVYDQLNFFRHNKNGVLFLGGKSFSGVHMIKRNENKITKVPSLPDETHYSYMWEDNKGNIIFGIATTFRKIDKLFLVDSSFKSINLENILLEENRILNINGDNFKEYIYTSTYFGYRCYERQSPFFHNYLTENISQGEFGKIMRGIINIPESDSLLIAREVDQWYHYNLKDNGISEFNLRDSATGEVLDFECCFDLVYADNDYIYSGGCFEELDEFKLLKVNPRTGLTKSISIPDVIQSISYTGDSLLYLGIGKSFRPTGQPQFLEFNIYTEEFNKIETSTSLSLIRYQEIQDSLIWLGTKNGLYKFNRENHSINKVPLEIRESHNIIELNPNITSLSQKDSILFIGTLGEGLFEYNLNTDLVEVYSISDGLPSNIISSITQYDEYLVIGTTYGLSIFNKNSNKFFNYFEEDGISNNEFNRFSNIYTEDGRCLLGTINGITAFKVDQLLNDVKFDSIFIDKIIVHNMISGEKIITDRKELSSHKFTFSPFVTSVEFFFNSPILNRGTISFNIKTGKDSAKWKGLKNTNKVELKRQKAGIVPVSVKAVSSFSGSQFEPLNISINFSSRFYELWYFWFIIIIVLLLIAIAFIRYRYNKVIKRRKRSMQKKVEMAEFELKALRAQMNPHFIFNAISSIQYYIMNNDSSTAEHYLSKFGMLMRNILENSRHMYIDLMEEIKFLKNYVELEKVRFHKNFTYEFHISEEAKNLNPKIPSMLLQPFIENSINHGIYHLEDRNGILEFNCYIENERLVIKIADNGIGRKKAGEIVYRRKNQHKSRATQIIDERIESLKLIGYDITYETIDLYDKNRNPEGTKVILTFPLTTPKLQTTDLAKEFQ